MKPKSTETRDLTAFATALKALRKAKELDQIDVAVAIGKSRQSVVAYEAGTNLPPVDVILSMAALFEVSPGSLVDLIPPADGGSITVSSEMQDIIDYTVFVNESPLSLALKDYPDAYRRLMYYFNKMSSNDQERWVEVTKGFSKLNNNNKK